MYVGTGLIQQAIRPGKIAGSFLTESLLTSPLWGSSPIHSQLDLATLEHLPIERMCHLLSLKTLLKTQAISLTTDKVESGQVGQTKECDLINPKNGLIQESKRGCRLAWSRLVDLGSIDSGSNPGSPTTKFLKEA